MRYNLSAGWGLNLMNNLPEIGTGKIFVVGGGVDARKDLISTMFAGNDPDGVVRYHATLDAAVSACTADANDTILVMPGHTETVTSTSIALDVAGVTIINLGNGKLAPTYTFSTEAATITVSADDIKWVDGNIIANYLDVASAFTIGTAKDFNLIGAKCEDSTAILNFLSIVTTGTTDNAADGLTVDNCYYLALNTTPLAFVSVLGDLARLNLSRNHVNSASTANVGHFVTFAAKDTTGAIIEDNELIVVGATNATVGIFLTGSGTSMTGIVKGNMIASLDTTSELIATAGTGLKYFENYYTGTADASGKLWPVVDAA